MTLMSMDDINIAFSFYIRDKTHLPVFLVVIDVFLSLVFFVLVLIFDYMDFGQVVSSSFYNTTKKGYDREEERGGYYVLYYKFLSLIFLRRKKLT
jgi:hypothetical protein